MATEVKLPAMGEGIDAGTVVRILVKAGESVQENQPLMELETDKALVEVPSSDSGTIDKVHVKEGEKVSVGATLISLKGGADTAKAEAEPQQKTEAKPEVKAEEKQPAAESSKQETEAQAEQRAAAGGQHDIKEQQGKPQTMQPASNGAAATPQRQQAKEQPSNGAPAQQVSDEIIPAGPSTRRLARELGLDLRQVPGSGQNGRITPEDVKAYAQRLIAGGGGGGAAVELPEFEKWGAVRREPVSQVRRITAEHMARSWNTVPHVTQFEKADITDLNELLKRNEEEAEQAGGKLTLTVLIIRAVISALKAQPAFNASLDLARGEIIYKDHYHIGIAVDTERGLLVPVLRDADRKDIIELSVELVELAERARSGKIDVDELRGGTFTISNQGGIGGAEFTPIVNWPEAAILGIGRARKEPAVVGDVVKPRMMCPLALSYDHRIVDGAMAARFIRRLKESLERPERLLLGL